MSCHPQACDSKKKEKKENAMDCKSKLVGVGAQDAWRRDLGIIPALSSAELITPPHDEQSP